MGKIESIRFGQARITLDDSCIRLFVRYKGKHCSKIRIWRLPKYNNLFSMFNMKNLFWAVCGDASKFLQGWFYKDGDLLRVLANKIERCSNEEDLRRFCLNLENIIAKGIALDIDELNS